MKPKKRLTLKRNIIEIDWRMGWPNARLNLFTRA